ncbi:MAG TPA: NmrA/HSCARG family protein [Vicinamibacterales bacterium]|nr:NmrA/HSCARG family protein [Vicinamibacterales bacterium]
MSNRIVVISGATGQQGGAVARALAGKGFTIRALTRNPDSDAAKAVAKETGAELVKAELDDEASIRAALNGAWGAFAVQNTWTAGVEGEEAQGHRFAKVARAAGIQHFVYTSVASADRQTGIPHFDNKARVEGTIRGLDFPSYAIIRPVFFMSNLTSPWFLNGDKLVSAMKPDTVLQMIATADIGQYGALAFTDAERFKNLEIDIAGDAKTMTETAAILAKALGRPIEYLQIPMSEIRKNSDDFALMLEWFERVGYDADIEGNAKEYGVKPTSLSEWASTVKNA